MTALEIILIIIIWVILGLFICHKRNWYVEEGTDANFACVFALALAPFNFTLTFFKVYLIDKWKN
jgi:hypothetical protein